MTSNQSLVPDSNKFIYAVLKLADQRGEFNRSEAVTAMVEYFKLQDEAQKERTANGHELRHKNRTLRAISNLKNAGLLEWEGPGRYSITALGRKEFANSGGVITHWYLREKT